MSAKKIQIGRELDYTNPSTTVAVLAGTLINSGFVTGVPNSDIAYTGSRLGAIDISECWRVDRAASDGLVFTLFTDPVWFDITNNVAVDGPGTGIVLGGTCIRSSASADVYVDVLRAPPLAGSAPFLITYQAADLAANTALAATYIGNLPRGGRLTKVWIMSQGTAAGIDNSNTLVIAIKDSSGNVIVTKTYNATNAFPANGLVDDLGALAVAYRNIAVGKGWTVTVTSSTNANPPAFQVITEAIHNP